MPENLYALFDLIRPGYALSDAGISHFLHFHAQWNQSLGCTFGFTVTSEVRGGPQKTQRHSMITLNVVAIKWPKRKKEIMNIQLLQKFHTFLVPSLA